MADLLYSWRDLEKNIINGDVGYFHGKDAKFNELKERAPEFIWLVRLDDKRLWLLGKLKVTSTRPTNYPKHHDKQFIFYNLSESFFFRDVETIQGVVRDTLDVACKTMRKSTMQGVGSLDVLDPHRQRELERLTRDAASISFDGLKQKLLDGSITSPPYRPGLTNRPIRTGSIAFENVPNELTPGADAHSAQRTISNDEVQETAGPGSLLHSDSTELRSPNSSKGLIPENHAGDECDSPITANDQENLLRNTLDLKTDEREAVVKVRFGQDGFREALFNLYSDFGERCWMSGIAGRRLLIASHIKPWSHCKKEPDSRGNPDNGLLLSALWDAAFDAGLISFDSDWKVLASSELSETARSALSLEDNSELPATFRTGGRKEYLAYHRAEVFEYWKKTKSE